MRDHSIWAVLVWVLGALAAFCGGGLWFASRIFGNLDYQANHHAPAVTFLKYFHGVPDGVSDIRATGFSSLGGADIYMRFQATDAAIGSLTAGYGKPETGKDARAACKGLAEKLQFYPLTDQPELHAPHQVRWDELTRIADPEVFVKPHEYAGSNDMVVVDPDRHVVYFWHWNQ